MTDMKANRLVLLVVAFVLLFARIGVAQEDVSKFPSKPITLVCPVPPGTVTDLTARLIAKEMEMVLGKPVVVENKPGASLIIGTSAVASAKPDGYTIGWSGGPPLYFTPLLEKVPFDPIRDLRTVAQYGAMNSAVAVKADSPFKNFKDLITYARQNPKKVTYGTTGANSLTNITIEQIAKQENVQFTHIPFQGNLETPLLGGHIMFGVATFGAPLVESGQLRLLMMMKEEKSTEYPNVPILKDLGYNVPFTLINAIITPRAVPDAIVKKLDDAIVKVMKEPSFLQGMKNLNLPVIYHSGKEVDALIAANYEYYKKIFGEMGLLVK
jgi:tripartite-type tricarboxylate transporter receptor subunit TctC